MSGNTFGNTFGSYSGINTSNNSSFPINNNSGLYIGGGVINTSYPTQFGGFASGFTTTGPTGATYYSIGYSITLEELIEIKPKIKEHRRLYTNDLSLLEKCSSLNLLGLIQNRLLIEIENAKYPIKNVISAYIEWLDRHLGGYYMVTSSYESTEIPDWSIIVSFQEQADMMQFLLAFR